MQRNLTNSAKSIVKIASFVGIVLICGFLLSACGPSQEAQSAAEQLVSDAQELVAEHRYADALKKYDEARDTDDGNVDIYVGIAEIYLLKNRESDAVEMLEEGIEKSRKPSDAYMVRGRIALEDGEIEEAITYLRNAVSKDKKNYEAKYLLADSYVDNDAFDNARSEVDVSDEGGDWYVRAQLLKAILIADDVEASREVMDDLEGVDIQDDDLSDQVDGFIEVLNTIDDLNEDESTPEYLDVLISYGALTADHENIAIERLSEYIDEGSEYWEVYLYLGRAYYMNGDLERAEELLSDAGLLNSTDPLGPWILARVYVELGQDTEMETQYKRAIALSEDDQRVEIRLEYTDVLLEKGLYAGADDQIDLLEAEDSDNTNSYQLLRVQSLIDREVYDDADDVLDEMEVSGLSDDLLAVYSWAKASALYGLGDREEALQWIEDAIEIDSADARFYLLEGQIHFQLGDEDTAKISLERAVDLDLEGEVSAEATKILDRL